MARTIRTFDIWKYQEAMALFFDTLLADPIHRNIYETLGGVPMDFQKIPVGDYAVTYDKAPAPGAVPSIEMVSVTFGEWVFEFRISEHYYAPSEPDTITINCEWKGNWSGRAYCGMDLANRTLEFRHRFTRDTIPTVFLKPIRKKTQITLNEAARYLADKAMYDNMKVLLNIKPPRKKK